MGKDRKAKKNAEERRRKWKKVERKEDQNATERIKQRASEVKSESRGMTVGVLAWRFRAVDVLKGWRAALLEVISVDYGGRVQRTAAPCNLPP